MVQLHVQLHSTITCNNYVNGKITMAKVFTFRLYIRNNVSK